MDSVCKTCSTAIVKDPVACSGSFPFSTCNAVYHPECIKLAGTCIKELARNRGLSWTCSSCRDLKADFANSISDLLLKFKDEMLAALSSELDRRLVPSASYSRSIADSDHSHGAIPIPAVTKTQIQPTHPAAHGGTIVATTTTSAKNIDEASTITRTPPTTLKHSPRKTETAVHRDEMVLTKHYRPLISIPTEDTLTGSSTRTRTSPPSSHNATTQDLYRRNSSQSPQPVIPPLHHGTGVSRSTDPPTIPKPDKLIWVFLSRFAPSVEEKDVIIMVQGRLGLKPDKFSVRRLTKKDANVKELTFVSFKLGVPATIRDLALSPSTWPASLQFREFHDHSHQHLDRNTSLISPTSDNYTITFPSLEAPQKTTHKDSQTGTTFPTLSE